MHGMYVTYNTTCRPLKSIFNVGGTQVVMGVDVVHHRYTDATILTTADGKWNPQSAIDDTMSVLHALRSTHDSS